MFLSWSIQQLKHSNPRQAGSVHISHQLRYRRFQNDPAKLKFCSGTCQTIGNTFPTRALWHGMVGIANVSGAGKGIDSELGIAAIEAAIHVHQEVQGLPWVGWGLEPQLC